MKELTIFFAIAAMVSVIFVCDRRISHKKYLHGLPYVLGSIVVFLSLEVTPQLGLQGLLIIPFIAFLHLMAVLRERYK